MSASVSSLTKTGAFGKALCTDRERFLRVLLSKCVVRAEDSSVRSSGLVGCPKGWCDEQQDTWKRTSPERSSARMQPRDQMSTVWW